MVLFDTFFTVSYLFNPAENTLYRYLIITVTFFTAYFTSSCGRPSSKKGRLLRSFCRLNPNFISFRKVQGAVFHFTAHALPVSLNIVLSATGRNIPPGPVAAIGHIALDRRSKASYSPPPPERRFCTGGTYARRQIRHFVHRRRSGCA